MLDMFYDARFKNRYLDGKTYIIKQLLILGNS